MHSPKDTTRRALAADLPELPDDKKARLVSQYGLSVYDAGVLITEAARAELWRDGLRFTTVYPGYVQTQISMNAVKGDGRANGVTDHNIAGGISAEACADAIWDAVETDEEEVMMGGKEVFYERFKRYAPQLFSFALKRITPKA